MKNYKFIIPLLTVLMLTGCGSSDTGSGVYDSFNNGGISNTFNYNKESYNDAALDYVEEEPAEEIETESSGQIMQDKLVYTCNIDIQTLEYSETISSIKSKIKKYNGIIESEREYDNNYNWYYDDYYKCSGTLSNNMTIRIPSEKYDEFLSSLDGEGKIISKESSVENISKQYYEVSTIIESLRIQEERLLSMMDSADTIEDMITVEARLTEVQTQLNQYNTQLSLMDSEVEYSTIYLCVEEVMQYVAEPAKTDTFLDRLWNTITETWEFFWDMLEGLLFFAIRIIPIAIVIVPIIFIVRFFIKRHKNKKQNIVNEIKDSEN